MSICRNNYSRNSFNNYYNQNGNMVVWFDCSDKTTLLNSSDNVINGTNGDDVAQIKNKAPKYANRFNLITMGTGGNNFQTQTVNSQTKNTVLTTTNSNAGFHTSYNTPSFTLPTQYTLFFVYKPTGTVGTGAGNFSKNATGSTNAYPFDNGTTARYFAGGGASYTTETGLNLLATQTTPIIVTHVLNKTANAFNEYINGTLSMNMGSLAYYADSNTSYLYFANRLLYTTSWSSNYLCEIIIYDTALSENARVYMEGILASKRNIQSSLPVGHTFKATIPPLLPNSYTTLNVPLCWYDTLDVSTLLNSSNNVINGTNNEFVKTMKNKAPNYKNSYDMVSIGNNVNSYNATLTKPSILTSNVATTGFNTLDYPPIPNGFIAFFVVKATGNTVNGSTSYFNKHITGSMGSPLQMYNTSRNIGNGTLSNAISCTHNFNTVTSTPILFVNKANKSTNSYSEYVNRNAGTTYSPSNYGDGNSRLYISTQAGNYTACLIHICEFIMYDSSLSDTARIYIEGYLASKWGIQSLLPAGHTYKSSTPPLTPDKYSVF